MMEILHTQSRSRNQDRVPSWKNDILVQARIRWQKYLQPDLWIRGGRGDYRGNGIYGDGQKARSFTRASRIRANFSIVWENDAVDCEDGSLIFPSGNTRGFKTIYFAAGGVRSNLTASMKTGSHETDISEPGGAESYSVKVRQAPRSRGLRFDGNLQAVSLYDPTKVDSVEMKVIHRR